jgi:hypothetical protein
MPPHGQGGASELVGPLSGPFAGVPFLIKDITEDYAGVPTTGGSRSMASVPLEHGNVVRRYLEAWLVVFGKTNLPEFGSRAARIPCYPDAPATYGILIAHRVAPAAVSRPRSPRLLSLWRPPATEGRFASPRRAVACLD